MLLYRSLSFRDKIGYVNYYWEASLKRISATASASSMHCGGETCSPGAVGCLSHSMSSADSDEYEDRLIRRRRSDDDYEINAVEVLLSLILLYLII